MIRPRSIRLPFPLWLLLMVSAIGCQTGDPQDTGSKDPLSEAAEVFEASCRLCHGTVEIQRGPILDGMPAWYVAGQLKKFRSGIRGTHLLNRSEHLMSSATNLFGSDQRIEALAEYVASLPPRPYRQTIRGNPAIGRTLFLLCATCHGPEGRGNEILKAPPLIFQEDWYRFDQLFRFRQGLRGWHPDDLQGRQMQAAVVSLNNQQFRDVVAYITRELSVNAIKTEAP